ncbi:sensor histidine kinase [Sporolactobacillus inulinus]|uniref:histidine kinase n=1 Tax=Sporolactobacillus inulinus CASD TaxID=1069536 RepID=A0A0U1QT55_9BACL|nr:histidine kinase [Sporolactobacillus inulinus]KLI03936.1 hypothetical protein SINU_00185 [Sporolactobacillus inulinus CASD]GEB76947.1 two-component sensor histidine kinase [Sporolactobacillus inulinus]
MNSIIDKLVLLLSCSILFLTGKPFAYDVLPFLLAIIFSCFLSYFHQERLHMFLVGFFLLISLFLPWLCVFLPLALYDMFYSRKQWICLLALLPFLKFRPLGTLQLDLGLCVLFLFSILLRFRTKALAQLIRRHYYLRDTTKEMARKLKRQNQNLLKKQTNELTMATLGERNRIAREIHDNVGHLLSRALLQTGALLAVSQKPQTTAGLIELKDTLAEAMTSIRKSVHDLHDESIDLQHELDKLIRKFTFCPMTLDLSVQRTPGSKLTYALISIVKEALSNIVRHSNATHAETTLREHPAFYQLIIHDNGQVPGNWQDQGMGLKNIQERVEAFHGIFTINEKNGFMLFISIPKEENRS